eukprot:CAMPEP_0170549790 /NCGR_PEP_ID=MMETSP0211-20121228/7942_1 /TAXON_ID=311385 /ORGANISM="Pseudokeronopsis sp., Strain OXSARD2" /LENGTH=106 /DNA_ID=CAMNT_0010856025 /DNA_START=601 /DNA_END=921 /DNA_ORIENTATION=-
MTLNSHSKGVSPSVFEETEVGAFYWATSVSIDDEGEPFVATLEAFDYPFFGTQFHPEKVLATFYPSSNVNHSEKSVYYNRYFADFFVDQTKRNFNQFESWEEEQSW